MKTTSRTFIHGAPASSATAGYTTSGPARAQSLSPADARQIAEEAYIYGYSLITTEVTRVQGSNVARPEGTKAPTGQFGNVERYLRVCREGAAIHFL